MTNPASNSSFTGIMPTEQHGVDLGCNLQATDFDFKHASSTQKRQSSMSLNQGTEESCTNATIKTDCIRVPTDFRFELCPGWTLEMEKDRFTLTHGKKSMTFDRRVLQDLMTRNYGLRLAMGRKQMVVTPDALQAFVDYETFFDFWLHKVD